MHGPRWLHRLKRELRRPFRARRLARAPLREVPEARLDEAFVSVLLPTWNRRPYLELGLPSLLASCADIRVEVLVWDNASEDDTAGFVRGLADPRLRLIESPENIGINALAALAREARGDYLLQLDDDVIAFPPGLIRRLLRAYLRLPEMGYLGAGVVVDAWTTGGRSPPWRSVRVTHEPGLSVDYGAVGGWCTLTDRALYEAIGGFTEWPGERYFWADRDYYRAVGRRGRRRGIWLDAEVYHAYRIAIGARAEAVFRADAEARDPERRLDGPKLADARFYAALNARFPGAAL